ncbi:MAG: sulfite exporter TauE/SafE family protein, partial [Clostridia bacterium]
MDQNIITKTLHIKGMTCGSCELRIESKLKKMGGVIRVKARLSKESVEVTFDRSVTSIDKISKVIMSLGYSIGKEPAKKDSGKLSVTQLIGIGILLFAVFWIINNTIGFNFIPQVSQNMGFGILFVVGLITSLHCVVMCGGINISQCVSKGASTGGSNGGNGAANGGSKAEKIKPSLMYNMGRVVSYTIIGGVVGALGSLVSFSGMAKGIVALVSGVFMVVMGLNMLNLFPWLKKFTPRLPRAASKILYEKFNNSEKSAQSADKKPGAIRGRGPFLVGLLNGFMPCGPLQTMQVYALGTGSFLAGAGAMFFFSLGTVPLMFGLGALSSFLSSRFTKNMMKVGAVLVMMLGIIMFSRGLNLSGVNFAQAAAPGASSVSQVEGNLQSVTTTLASGQYEPITVRKGVPVKWTVQAAAKDINGCNETMTVPEYGITKKLVPGDNIIEFTPTREGTIKYTCWMGMISSTITVLPNDAKAGGPVVANAPTIAPTAAPATTQTANIQLAKKVGKTQEISVT